MILSSLKLACISPSWLTIPANLNADPSTDLPLFATPDSLFPTPTHKTNIIHPPSFPKLTSSEETLPSSPPHFPHMLNWSINAKAVKSGGELLPKALLPDQSRFA
jgi:hypothetical protein